MYGAFANNPIHASLHRSARVAPESFCRVAGPCHYRVRYARKPCLFALAKGATLYRRFRLFYSAGGPALRAVLRIVTGEGNDTTSAMSSPFFVLCEFIVIIRENCVSFWRKILHRPGTSQLYSCCMCRIKPVRAFERVPTAPRHTVYGQTPPGSPHGHNNRLLPLTFHRRILHDENRGFAWRRRTCGDRTHKLHSPSVSGERIQSKA